MIINFDLLKKFKILSPDNRLHHIPTPIVAITGGIATGKSTLVDYIKQKGWGVISADILIKDVYQQTNTKNFLMHLAPDIMDSQGKIDFTKLRSLAFSDHKIKESLEQFLYSQLPDVFWKFYKLLPAKPYFFYEVPLLFEKNLQCLVDLIVVLYTDPKVQLQRLSLRDNSSPEINEKIIQSQMPFENKKKLSHYIVDNNGSNEQLYSQVDILLENIQHVFQP